MVGRLKPTDQCYAFWSNLDGEWVGVCPVFPSLSFLAPTQREAQQGIAELVVCVQREMAEDDG